MHVTPLSHAGTATRAAILAAVLSSVLVFVLVGLHTVRLLPFLFLLLLLVVAQVGICSRRARVRVRLDSAAALHVHVHVAHATHVHCIEMLWERTVHEQVTAAGRIVPQLERKEAQVSAQQQAVSP